MASALTFFMNAPTLSVAGISGPMSIIGEPAGDLAFANPDVHDVNCSETVERLASCNISLMLAFLNTPAGRLTQMQPCNQENVKRSLQVGCRPDHCYFIGTNKGVATVGVRKGGSIILPSVHFTIVNHQLQNLRELFQTCLTIYPGLLATFDLMQIYDPDTILEFIISDDAAVDGVYVKFGILGSWSDIDGKGRAKSLAEKTKLRALASQRSTATVFFRNECDPQLSTLLKSERPIFKPSSWCPHEFTNTSIVMVPKEKIKARLQERLVDQAPSAIQFLMKLGVL